MYQETIDITGQPNKHIIQRISDGAFIPINDLNTDYQEYKKWLAAGNKLKPAKLENTPKKTTITKAAKSAKGTKAVKKKP